MKNSVLLLLVLITSSHLVGYSQVADLSKHFKQLKPRSIGPAGMSGRVTAIDAVHTNPGIIYIGSASGGVWKTENGGASWQPVFDDQSTQNIGAIAIQQSNPSIIWAGTGEGNPRNSINIGEGIYKSLDAGKTWKKMGLEKTRNIHRILIDPTNPSTIYVAAIGNPYATHPERGVFKTTDGGENWTRILYANDTTGCAELVMDPSNPNKLIANLWQHNRTPWGFTSGGPGGGIYTTWDGGKNWKKMGKEEGIPDSIGRVGITISNSDPKVIYALIESKKNGLYRSEDGGFKWKTVNESAEWVTNRPFYFQDIRVDPNNENRLYNINQMISVSEDGGRTFRILLPYSGVHPDHHAWWINPLDASFIIDGNDGGISVSRDRGRTWQFDEKLPLGQFYHINVDNEMPYHVMGGMQDNGSWRGPAYTWAIGGIRNYYWQGIGGGDGFDASPDPDDADWVYSMSQGGYLRRINATTGEEWSIEPPMPDTTVRIRFNWNSAFAQDPFDHNTIYFGSQFVHKSANKGAAWSIISPDLTTNDKIKQRQDENGGLTIDITNAENHCTILTIEPSPIEKNVLWVGTDDGNIQLTRDGGATWTNLTNNIKGFPKACWIQQVRASRFKAGEAFLVANNYRQGDFGAYIFRTTDYGKTWTRMVDDNKVKGYALCMIQDPVQPNLVFVGTENGLWISLDNGGTFQQFKNEYPSVSTYDLAIQERESDLAIATFGRAIYVLDDIRPLRDLAARKGMLPNKKITMLNSQVAYQHFTNAPAGIDWSNYGLYAAENKRDGAMVNVFFNNIKASSDSIKTVKKVKSSDSITIKILNQQGDTIRSYKEKLDSGFNRLYWDYSTKGIRQPGSLKPKKDAPEPANGLPAPPGDYKMVVQLNGVDSAQKDSVTIVVKYDPRSTFPAAIYEAQKKMISRLNASSEKLTAALDQLAEEESIIKKVDSQLKEDETPAADSIRKAGKTMQDSINQVRDYIMGKKQEKQGYGRAYQLTPVSCLSDASNLIIGKTASPGMQEETAVKIAEDMVQKSIEKVNRLSKNIWTIYRKKVEAMPIVLFKDLQPL
ncbi:MAG: hypothetical protein V4717_17785 [Bacteroidota bacterium]